MKDPTTDRPGRRDGPTTTEAALLLLLLVVTLCGTAAALCRPEPPGTFDARPARVGGIGPAGGE